MTKTTRIPLGAQNEIISYIKDGHSIAEAVEHSGISKATIYKILRLAKVPVPRKRKLDLKEVETYLREHPYLMLKEYAHAFNVSIPGLHQFLNKHGIDYRNNSTR